MEIFANGILKQDKIKFRDINPKLKDSQEYLNAIQEEALEKLGYFLKPEELFTEVAKRGNGNNEEEDQFDATKTNFILEDLQKILTNIQLSTMGTDSEDDFDNLFEDMDLNSTKLGKSPEARNEIIAKVLFHLDKIDILTKNAPLVLDKLWCNFMKKYEFNPLHGHSGVFSFIIFLKIPYDLQKEDKVFPEVNKIHLTSRLQFVTVSPTTGIQSIILNVDKSFENKMLIFPANFKHEVYPFYTSDEERITVSGNIKFFNG
jgi:hypothetical protein